MEAVIHLGHSSLIITEMLQTLFVFFNSGHIYKRKKKKDVDPKVTTSFILHSQDSALVLA